MIYVTGDTHWPIDASKLYTRNFPEQKDMNNNNDYVIICGDFGMVWDGSSNEKKRIAQQESRKYTTLFIDGNHENFELLEQLPRQKQFGSEVGVVSPHILHLLRGNIYNVCGSTFLCMGGAASHDKEFRRPFKTWWPDEMPSRAEYERCRKTLQDHDYKVDYIITHCAPDRFLLNTIQEYKPNPLTNFLESEIAQKVEFKHWYFGHYHMYREFDKYTVLYNQIIKIK